MTPKRPPMSKEAKQKRKDATQRTGGGCATCNRIRSALMSAARLMAPRR